MVPRTTTAHDSHLVVFLYHGVHQKLRIHAHTHAQRRERDAAFGPMMEKRKKKMLATGVYMCLNAHSHIHTLACMILEGLITARERKERK